MENKNTIYLIQTIGYNEIFYFYVDKTELILHLNKLIHTSYKYVCIMRPRRFGKTVTVNMITEYYQYLEKETTNFRDKYLNKLNIIKFI